MDPRILQLQEITAEPVGGKAAGLAELKALGLNIPAAFVIQYAQVGHYPADLDTHYRNIGGGSVAVRSSAIGEDGADSSFAGQYETILNVEGDQDLRHAIDRCVESLSSERASSYKQEQAEVDEVAMCIVVQRMVNARAAGVVFTADPVSGRHDRLVIDAVEGLGEALVSGEATPDHYELDISNQLVNRALVGDSAILSEAAIEQIADEARQAARDQNIPLDLEWAIDASGELFWLQARPITTIGSDLNELDTSIPPDHVITRCNVGEMMPGAVCPLTFSVQGRAIEHGMQHMHVEFANRPAITDEWTQINQFYGHLYINMTGGMEAARYVSITTPESSGQSLCGRTIPELKAPEDLAPWWRRWYGTLQFTRYCLRGQKVLTEFEQRFKHAHIVYSDDSRSMIQAIDQHLPWLNEMTEVHLRSSAGSGVMEGVLQSLVSGSGEANAEQQAEAARLLAGADNVESAVMVERLDEVIDAIAKRPDAVNAFQQASPAAALDWLRSANAGSAQQLFSDFMHEHGHRSYRELCVRERGWIDEPEKLIVTMQASVASRLSGEYRPKPVSTIDLAGLPWLQRKILPLAHGAVRRREHTKSMLVLATHRLKRAYRHLAELLVQEGSLPDQELLFFFTHRELVDFVQRPSAAWVERACQRQRALSFHEKMEFDDISVGKPEPLSWQATATGNDGELIGRPVSRGVVEGPARVALTVQEAAALKPGEILIAPITDIGWTPYFSLIAGLATDVGSAVSHGAVIAREYGLPAIVNLRAATKTFQTGERVRLDADRGTLRKIDSTEPA